MHKLKEFLAKIVDRNRILRALFTAYKCAQNQGFSAEVDRRSKISIFDYKALAKELVEYPYFYIPDCNYYGLYHHLLGYAGLGKEDLNLIQKHYFYIEHGLVLGTYANQYNMGKAKLITTLSPVRKSYIDGIVNGVPTYVIGPYIHYCPSLLSADEIIAQKAALGKVLLVIPSHSIGSVTAQFDERSFISSIHEKMVGYDTVIVCLYWKDIDNGVDAIYLKEGFKVSTAGHRDDLNFIPRLKSLLLLASEIFTNNLGTHLAYALEVGVPISIYKQKVNYKEVQFFKSNQDILKNEQNVISSRFDRKQIEDALANDDRLVLNQYFGLDQVKSPVEMRKLLLSIK
ncbi:hypothetical protein [Sphingobacterium sp. HMA12]|uniref:hypothetical protein n=1 Tax=Sphingobacterium sp. HMA12 TaxID=2050894 RepID=UPI000CEA2E9C|nr:hypothetical protein [Sphingobacterium sp. HMA12]